MFMNSVALTAFVEFVEQKKISFESLKGYVPKQKEWKVLNWTGDGVRRVRQFFPLSLPL